LNSAGVTVEAYLLEQLRVVAFVQTVGAQRDVHGDDVVTVPASGCR